MDPLKERYPWEVCFLEYMLLDAQLEKPVWRSDNLCPICHFSHLSVRAYAIVSTWLAEQDEDVRETALILGQSWVGTWPELQIASVRLCRE